MFKPKKALFDVQRSQQLQSPTLGESELFAIGHKQVDAHEVVSQARSTLSSHSSLINPCGIYEPLWYLNNPFLNPFLASDYLCAH